MGITRFYHEENRYFAALEPLSETYQLFTHESVSQTELKQQLDKQGFQLLSEDQWEYVCGAATRRLFRWGNESPAMMASLCQPLNCLNRIYLAAPMGLRMRGS